jgi:hypothetical protein
MSASASKSTRHALYAVAESTYGVTPATPSFTRLRNTSCNIGLAKEGFVSEESDPKRQIRDYRHGNKQTGGEVGFELSYGSFDTVLAAILFSADWAPRLSLESDAVSVDDADNSYNAAAILPEFRVGEWIDISGFTTGANNGAKQVVTSTTSKLVVLTDGDNPPLVDEAAGDTVTLATQSESIKAATTSRSYTLMRQFEDQVEADEPFHLFPGWVWNTFNLTVAPGGAIKGTFSGMGKTLTTQGEAPAGAILGAASTSRMFDSFTGWVKEGDTTLGHMTELTLTLENGVEPLFVCFSDSTEEPTYGRSNLTGQMTVHFKNSALLNKFIDETPSSIEFQLVDKAGNAYRFYIPNVSYNGGQTDTAAEGVILIPMPFQAIADSILDSQIRVERIPAVS